LDSRKLAAIVGSIPDAIDGIGRLYDEQENGAAARLKGRPAGSGLR